MKIRFLKLLQILLICAGFSGPAQAMDAENKTLLVVGDSLSAGFGLDLADTWVALLESKLNEEGGQASPDARSIRHCAHHFWLIKGRRTQMGTAAFLQTETLVMNIAITWHWQC